MVATLSKFTVLCLSSYSVYFLKLKLILFYNEIFLILFSYPRGGTLTGPTTPNQGGPGSNGSEGYSTFPEPQEGPQYKMQFSVISRILLCEGGRVYYSAKMQSAYSTAPIDWGEKKKKNLKKNDCNSFSAFHLLRHCFAICFSLFPRT